MNKVKIAAAKCVQFEDAIIQKVKKAIVSQNPFPNRFASSL